LSIKYQAAGILSAFLLIETRRIWASLRSEGAFRWKIFAAGLALAVGAMAFTPLRNFIVKGNPLYPMTLGGRPPFDDFFSYLFQDSRATQTAANFFKMPWIYFSGGAFVDGMGPLLAALLPGLFFIGPWPRPLRRALALFGAGLMTTYLLFNNWWAPRFYLPCLILLAMFGALALNALIQSQTPPPRWIYVLMAAGLAPAFLLNGLYAANRARFALGLESQDAFMRRANYAYYPWDLVQKVNAAVPRDQIIFFFSPSGQFYYWEPRTHALDNRSLWDQADPQKILDYFRAAGYRYFIFSEKSWTAGPGGGRRSADAPDVFVPWLTDAFLKTHFEEIDRQDGFVFLRLKPAGGTPA
jgi:hypothetical protein